MEKLIEFIFYRYWHYRALKAGFTHLKDDMYQRGSFVCNKWGVISLLRGGL